MPPMLSPWKKGEGTLQLAFQNKPFKDLLPSSFLFLIIKLVCWGAGKGLFFQNWAWPPNSILFTRAYDTEADYSMS